MSPKRRIIIDTDPGVDDTLALLLALSASKEELEVLLISLTYGNVEVEKCARNIITLFEQVKKEISWRQQNGRPLGFETLRAQKPVVAIGATKPLTEQLVIADYFHGVDGLGNIYETHPHLSPSETWRDAFKPNAVQDEHALFRTTHKPAHEEILRVLDENDKDTITIVAIGPLTNLALAAAQDPETFLKVKEVVVMGGTIDRQGNITPVAEFNTFADSVAAARVYALSSPRPSSTMPPAPPKSPGTVETEKTSKKLGSYPGALSRKLNVTMFPLDITSTHELTKNLFMKTIEPLIHEGCPLAGYTKAFLSSTFTTTESLRNVTAEELVSITLHDPLCVWYCMITDRPGWKMQTELDLRVETTGQWTRGMCVVDRRDRRRREVTDESKDKSDNGDWLSPKSGNRLSVCQQSPGADVFARDLLNRVFGLQDQ